jgi:GNAT superfamily N-acetyltransferase
MKAAVIVFPGSNCDRDCKVAIERSTGAHVDMVWHGDTALPDAVDLIVLPGGFSYGDYLRCGAMASLSPIMAEVKAAAGRGVARRMCAHSLEQARGQGYRAMQFNFVVSTNQPAVHLWQSMGFAIVGRLPGAFAHPQVGDVDAYVMYQKL